MIVATGGAAAPPGQVGAARVADGVVKLHPRERAQVGRAPSSRLARTDASLLGRSGSERVSVLVKLDHDAVASYSGDLPGFAATSPSVTGRRLGRSAAERAYEEYLIGRERSFANLLSAKVPEARIGQRLRTVYGGVGVTLPANQVKELLTIDGVVAVQRDELREPLTDASSSFIGADTVQQGLGGDQRAGKGVIVGILDTGAWPEHPSFADSGVLDPPPAKADGTVRACDFGDNPRTKVKDVFRCTNKLIGGAAFIDAYLAVYPKERYRTARDSDGHGTHTGSTAAGNSLRSAKIFGVERGPIRGVAPGAWVSVYKVCGAHGCFSSDSAAAVAQAVRDGVDVINFSISGGTDPFTDPVEMAFLDAYAAGVFVAASAGNSGPEAGTVNHLSPWVTTVAASTQRREFAAALVLTSGDATKRMKGVSVTGGVGPAPVVRAAKVTSYAGGAKCLKPAESGAFTGQIVVCERGVNARVAKGWNVRAGGAVGMILYNPTLQDVNTDNHWLPTVHVADAKVLDFLSEHADVRATIEPGAAANGTGDVMAAFSSRGPAGLALKPDVTAPGVQILAGHTPTPDEVAGGPPGEFFQAIAGTSMSAPQVAGAAALLAAAHPGWSPGQIKSALMTTAVTDVVAEDLSTPAGPLDFGSGRIAVDAALQPGLTVSETADRMLALAGDPVRSVDLNLPSINAPVMPGRISTIRTVRNTTDVPRSYLVETTAPRKSSISVTPRLFAVPAGGEQDLRITVSSSELSGDYLFGEVRLVPSGGAVPPLHLPISFRPGQGRVTLTGACDPDQLPMGEQAECVIKATNTGYTDTTVDLRTEVDQRLKLVSAQGARIAESRTVEQERELRGVKPGIPELAGPGQGWRPLGIDADPIGDEEIVNYDVPKFRYAGETYSRIAVTSNGYLVVGGGTVQDVRYEPPAQADAARPNNVLAPYWADLDGSADEGIRVGVVNRSGRSWIAVEWQVKRYGTNDRQRFQVWLETGTSSAGEIAFAYDPEKRPSGAKVFAVGAENALGQGTLVAKAPEADLTVRSTGGRLGDSVTYRLIVRGLLPGDEARLVTRMRSPHVPGTTVVRTPLVILPPEPPAGLP